MKTKISPLEKQLNETGITLDALVETAMSMYIYDPKIGSNAKVKKKVRKEFMNAFCDINVSSLVTAGLLLEQAGKKGAIPGISAEKYSTDPVDLVADEILGQSIAVYIAGTRAFFEFERLDKKKPGILRTLPPFIDDVIIGLVSGVIVKVCSR